MTTKQFFIKFFGGVTWLFIFGIFFGAATTFAGTYYASSSGSASWANSTNISTPCSIVTALTNAVAGDTINLRGGTYTTPASAEKCNGTGLTSVYVPDNDGTSGNPIIFQNYEDETVFFDNSNNIGIGCDLAAYGAWNNSYITWDGIDTVAVTNGQGRAVTVWNSDNIIIKNAEIKGVTADSNNSGLRIEDSSFVTIQNNKIWNVYGSSDTTNPSAIELYDSSNIIIDHNDLYNCQNGIYVKNNIQNLDITYNFIYNISNVGIRINPKWPYMANIDIYHNIITGSTGIGDSGQSGDGEGYADIFLIYNNTMYVTNDGFKTDPYGSNSDYRDISFFNNIIYNTGTTQYYFRLSDFKGTPYVDYNIFYNIAQWRKISTTYTELSTWSSATPYDRNSTVSNPNFVNASGFFNIRSDFKRSSYPTNGRGGSYSSVIGAYITGNEVIGYTPDGVEIEHSRPGAPIDFLQNLVDN